MGDRIKLEDFFRFYRDLPHQKAAVRLLSEAMPDSLLRRDATWCEVYRAAGKQPEKAPITNPLRVRYFSQLDSRTSHASRMCFSSACAMMLEALKPGTLEGPNGDDLYLGRVMKYGDTTTPRAQIKALESFGQRAEFCMNGSFDDVRKLLDQGIPVPMGILHQGHVEKPVGGGHWITAIGYDSKSLVVHDPFGDLDLIRGAYLNNWGARLRYSYKNTGPRWMVEGEGSGWFIRASI